MATVVNMKRQLRLTLTTIALVFVIIATVFLFEKPMEPVQAQGGVTVFANLRVSNFFRAQKRSTVLVSMNGSINPTGTYQPISATVGSAVSVSGDNLTVKPAGTVLTLVNTGGQTITITETTNMKSAGNVALGTLDSATFISDGSDWYQIAASNN
jgi:hypothetical protein